MTAHSGCRDATVCVGSTDSIRSVDTMHHKRGWIPSTGRRRAAPGTAGTGIRSPTGPGVGGAKQRLGRGSRKVGTDRGAGLRALLFEGPEPTRPVWAVCPQSLTSGQMEQHLEPRVRHPSLNPDPLPPSARPRLSRLKCLQNNYLCQ